LMQKNKKWNPWWNFKDIMALEEKYNAKSSFYFLALNKEDLDFNFKIEDLEYEITDIADNGWEVGLHGGHEAYNNLDEINKEKKNLEKVLGKEVLGYRNHYLRFKVPDTWEFLIKSGFKYDTTFGYADCVGFRNGMCHPFKPFNINTNREIDILEIPLTIMDSTLFNYMKLDIKGAWDIIKLLIDTVEKYNGVITILWHNTYMIDEYLKLYEKILNYCYDKGAWMTSGDKIEKGITGIGYDAINEK
jgi:peptidoglycan/xylan/chitin deacetylase (PgdA/CDA1 family)